MEELKSEAFKLYTEGRSTTEIAKLLDVSWQKVAEWKNTVEWVVAHENWKRTKKQEQETLLLCMSTFVVEEMKKMIKNKNTPANIKADLLKYIGGKIADIKSFDSATDKKEAASVEHVDTNTLVDIKGKLKDKE